jgi:hypothetical protein
MRSPSSPEPSERTLTAAWFPRGTVQLNATEPTDVLRSDDDTADTHRLVMVRPNGTLLLIESIGMPAAGIPAPLSNKQLDELACTLDNPSSDLDVDTDGSRAPMLITSGSSPIASRARWSRHCRSRPRRSPGAQVDD